LAENACPDDGGAILAAEAAEPPRRRPQLWRYRGTDSKEVRAVMDDDPARLQRYDGRAARPVSPMGDCRQHWEVRRDRLEIDGGAAAAPSRSPE